MNLKQMGSEGVDWIDQAQERDQCRAFVNTVMNFQVVKKRGIARRSE
jgi:hypothetical protein